MFTSVFTSLSYQISAVSKMNPHQPVDPEWGIVCWEGGGVRPGTTFRNTFTPQGHIHNIFFLNKYKHIYVSMFIHMGFFVIKIKTVQEGKKNQPAEACWFLVCFVYYWGRGLRPEARRCSFLWHGEFIPPGNLRTHLLSFLTGNLLLNLQ